MNRIITILLFACVFIFSACIKDPVFDQIEYVNTLDAYIDANNFTFTGEYCVEDNGEKNTWECAVRIGYDSLLKDSWIVCSKSTSDDFYKHKPTNNVKQFTVEIEPNVYDTTYYYCAFMQKGDKELAAGDVRKIYFGRPVFDPNGASNAVFTVASGRTVHFSRGNLQYQASTNTWRFAEHQYDIVGSANSNISSSYSGWIDLFGWGTSGWNSGAVCYQPWATSTSYSDYRPGGSYANNLTGAYANADWGVYNRISNGGNQAGMWRTLTRDEWSYLLNSRAASTINGEANARYAKAVVNGKNGLVIFPDNFTMPSGMSYPSGINTFSATFNSNTYTPSQWSQMEGAGCIFLPAAGYRNGTDVYDVGTYGDYWSSSYYDWSRAWYIDFGSGDVSASRGDRGYGRSVRLVRD